ncbi:MAG: hypothetical protein ACOX5R_08445 [bacterium]|jgi:hypothetical protein
MEQEARENHQTDQSTPDETAQEQSKISALWQMMQPRKYLAAFCSAFLLLFITYAGWNLLAWGWLHWQIHYKHSSIQEQLRQFAPLLN